MSLRGGMNHHGVTLSRLSLGSKQTRMMRGAPKVRLALLLSHDPSDSYTSMFGDITRDVSSINNPLDYLHPSLLFEGKLFFTGE